MNNLKIFFILFISLFFIGCSVKPLEVEVKNNNFSNEKNINIDVKNIKIEKIEKKVEFAYGGFGDSNILINTKVTTASIIEKDLKDYFSTLQSNENSDKSLKITIKEAIPYWVLGGHNNIPVINIFTAGLKTDFNLSLNILFEIEDKGKVISSYTYDEIVNIKNSAAVEEQIKIGYLALIDKYRELFFNDIEERFIKRYL